MSTSTQSLSKDYSVRLKKYYFQCFVCEVSKIIIFAFIFYYMQLFREFLISLFFLIILRSNGGGLHCKHYISCFLLSLTVLGGNIYLAASFFATYPFLQIISVVCLIISYHFVPITSSYRPKPVAKIISRSKRNTGIIILTFTLLTCLIPVNPSITIGFWAIVIHTCQLILAKYIERRNCNV